MTTSKDQAKDGRPASEPLEPRLAAEELLDAFRRADVEALIGCLGDDVIWEPMGMVFLPHGTRHDGKEAVVRDFLPDAMSLYDMSAWEFDGEVIAADGDVVVVEWIVKAKSARGREYENRYCVVLTIRDGKLRHVREYTDTRYMQRVLIDG
jgi:ketosteroid isomerase-like protein